VDYNPQAEHTTTLDTCIDALRSVTDCFHSTKGLFCSREAELPWADHHQHRVVGLLFTSHNCLLKIGPAATRFEGCAQGRLRLPTTKRLWCYGNNSVRTAGAVDAISKSLYCQPAIIYLMYPIVCIGHNSEIIKTACLKALICRLPTFPIHRRCRHLAEQILFCAVVTRLELPRTLVSFSTEKQPQCDL